MDEFNFNAEEGFNNNWAGQDSIDEADTFEANEEANSVIKKIKRVQAEQKKQALASMIQSLNEFCAAEDIRYFAVGNLLSFVLSGVDEHPDEHIYKVYMFRPDYEKFVATTRANAGDDIKFVDMYTDDKKMKIVHRKAFRINKSFESGTGYGLFKLSLDAIPVDILPEDEAERSAFIAEVHRKTKEYKRLTAYTHNDWADPNPSFISRLTRKWRLKTLYTPTFFYKYHADYKALLSRYDESDSHVYGRIETHIGDPFLKEDIWPHSTVDFLGTRVMIPARPEMFAALSLEESERESRRIGLLTLERLDKLCTENDITYFAYGSLLNEYVDETAPEDVPLRPYTQWRIGVIGDNYNHVIDVIREKAPEYDLVLRDHVIGHPDIPVLEKSVVAKEYNKVDAEGNIFTIRINSVDYLPDNFDETAGFVDELKEIEERCKVYKDYLLGKLYSEKLSDDVLSRAYAELRDTAARYCQMENPNRVARLVGVTPNGKNLSAFLPVKRDKFHGIEINIPANKYLSYNDTNDFFTEEFVRRKAGLMSIVNEVCKKLDISYFAIANLLISAVVYNGALPNQGNYTLTFGLMRDEFNRLIEYLREHDHEHGLSLIEYHDAEHKIPLRAMRIAFEGDPDDRIYVNPVPFDRVPESFYLRKAFRDEMRDLNEKYRAAYSFRVNRTTFEYENYTPEEIREIENCDLLALAAEINEKAQKYNDDPLAFACEKVTFSFSKIIERDDVFPTVNYKLYDVDIPCPNDYTVWQPMQNDDLAFQLKCIQEADKKLTLELDRVCREIGVGYFVCGGTMLGYMRHKGFIPWDDDVDVAMLRADYDRFLKEAPALLGEEYFLQTRESDPNIPYLFSKLRINGTEYITQYNRDRDFHKGLCLDIFPFDYIPNEGPKRDKFVEDVIALSKEHGALVNAQLPEIPEPFPPRNQEEEDIINEQKALIQTFTEQSLEETQQNYLDMATMYNDRAEELDLTTVASFVPSYTYIDVKDLLPYQRGQFEDIEVSVPQRPDVFLTMQYGDYMSLPPKHMQMAHRLLRWSDGVNGQDNEKKRDYSALNTVSETEK
ncbi:MAG: LicD family protein [Eubacterium sp.]|nr:LicD family protein [Eubacterium sp.]